MMRACDHCGRVTRHVVIGYGGISCVWCQVAAGADVPPDVLEAWRADFRRAAADARERGAARYVSRLEDPAR